MSAERIALTLVFDPVNDLTLAEKLAIATEYDEVWWDDLDFVIVGPQGLTFPWYRMLKVIECPMSPRLRRPEPQSVYLFKHS